jgi:Sulfate permease and related transporters (MFS superfamily)
MARSKKAVEKISFSELFQPKLITVLREGYHFVDFRADVVAGLTVAIVALPLSIAIAIASGASPVQGLYTSIVGGFFIALLGGSRFQIGGPAGAFIIIVSTTVAEHGMDGLLLAYLYKIHPLSCYSRIYCRYCRYYFFKPTYKYART